MRKLRFSIGGLMGIVLAAAVGLTALKSASRIWAGAMLLLTCGILALGVVGAIYRQGTRRAWWLGFSHFGWGYMALWCFWSVGGWPDLPTTTARSRSSGPGSKAQLLPMGVSFVGRRGVGALAAARAWNPSTTSRPDTASARSWPPCWGACSRRSSSCPRGIRPTGPARCAGDEPANREPVAPADDRRARVLVLIAAAAAIWAGSHAARWAVVTFALTCALIGLAILAAVLGRRAPSGDRPGRRPLRRGLLALVFGRPAGQPPRVYFATDQVLDALRPGLRRFPRTGPQKTCGSWKRWSSRFRCLRAETPLDDVLK